MTAAYDVIVLGLGAMGSSAAYQLAKRGVRVLGIEQFAPAHELGSSGGLSRIIRLAYFEHPDYVPMLKAAWALWPQIEAEAATDLLKVTGGLYVGREGSAVLDGSRRSALEHGLAHEVLNVDEMRVRFPQLVLDDDMAALHEPLAGALFPEKCIAAHLSLAQQHGATLNFGERVSAWSSDGGGVSVTTDKGTYAGAKLVIAAGAWLPALAPNLDLPLTVERNSLYWYEPAATPEIFEAERFPVWIMELNGEHAFYGFPRLPNQGVKVARHHGGGTVDANMVDRSASDEDERPVRDFISRYMPALNGRRLDSRVCMYTNTSDFNFILDFHPEADNVVIASPCSGHGFKFSSVIGSIVADLATTGRTHFEIEFLSVGRFFAGLGESANRHI